MPSVYMNTLRDLAIHFAKEHDCLYLEQPGYEDFITEYFFDRNVLPPPPMTVWFAWWRERQRLLRDEEFDEQQFISGPSGTAGDHHKDDADGEDTDDDIQEIPRPAVFVRKTVPLMPLPSAVPASVKEKMWIKPLAFKPPSYTRTHKVIKSPTAEEEEKDELEGDDDDVEDDETLVIG